MEPVVLLKAEQVEDIDYRETYEALYQKGYHKDDDYSHAKELCKWLRDNLQFESILDIGCSHGWVLRYFYDRLAVGLDPAESAVKRCIESGSLAMHMNAHELDVVDTYDVVMSTECFEHIHPRHVEASIAAAVRAAKHFVAMQISTRRDQAKWKYYAGHDLHLTIRDIQWWKDRFLQHGGKIIEEWEDTFIISYEQEEQ